MAILGEEFDSFWDLSSMIKSKKKSPNKSVKNGNDITSDLSEQASHQDNKSKTLSFSVPNARLILKYAPQHSPFLTEVKLYRIDGRYSFYSSFRDDALRYFDRSSEATNPVPYFSYIPQYAQMTKSQLDFYFYFRANAKRGEFIPCDVSYFWLYIYEIINLPDKIPPQDGVKRMCLAWAAFRDKHPKIDKYMSVWLADYCLVNAVPCPTEYIGKFLPSILEHTGFKEFYLGHAMESNVYGVHTLLSLVSAYQWQKSKFLLSLDQNERQHILLSLIDVVKVIYESPSLFNMEKDVTTMCRDAYSGSLCGHNIKCRIEITYHKIDNVGKLADVVTAAVKYAENRMRILHGQKSRLTVGDALLPSHRILIDAYFDRLTPQRTPQKSISSKAEYEKQYDADTERVSFTKALSIENASWENTRKLVEGTEDVACEVVTFSELAPRDEVEKEEVMSIRSRETQRRDVLTVLLQKGSIPFDFEVVSLCEEINSEFYEKIGDIIISITDKECTLIEDYREEIEICLNHN